jgi:hypothetical protein
MPTIPLCTPDDVARALGIDPTPDAPWAEAAIESASSWVRRFLRRPNLGTTGEAVEKFFHVEASGYVNLEGVPTLVSVVAVPGATPAPLAADLWEYDGEGVRLFSSPEFWLLGGSPQSAPWAVDRDYYERVDVTTVLAASVDPIVRDGVAVAAAALMMRSPRLAKGLAGEKIGDYSYTLARVESSDPWFEQAKSILRPLRRVPDLVP